MGTATVTQPQGTAPTAIRLQIGDREMEIGTLPDLSGLPEAERESLYRQVAASCAGKVEYAALRAESALAAQRVAALCGDELPDALATVQPGGDPAGPVVSILRRRAGLSRSELGRAVHLAPRTLARWEAGQPTRCSVWTLQAVADALGEDVMGIYLVAYPAA